MNKGLIIKQACYHFNYKWPADLWTGIMYFDGYKITVEEFNAIARMFR